MVSDLIDFEQGKKSKEEYLSMQHGLYKKVELIGETYIREVLKTHILQVEARFNVKDFLQRKKIELENQLNNINKELNE
ncbi:DUF5320 domain-containing protein [Flavobacterium covae]|uniref:DUF5320 domain-containing protein n=1 Tax=Flavobacterium covae TaxID=2906076 RepID=UPI000745DEB8|nr:DUF5320 domain-containing protein [Flavobacterium covae]AMA49022.1 hypothetical protein AWN65_05870 [Flavobacterium covae]MCJ1810454.1 DUF5320 domain-containing protein [Flavobacterium covae]